MTNILWIDSNSEKGLDYTKHLNNSSFHYTYLKMSQRKLIENMKNQDLVIFCCTNKFLKKTLELIEALKTHHTDTPHIIINYNKDPKFTQQLLKTNPSFYVEGNAIQENLKANIELTLKRERPIHQLKQIKDLSHIYIKKFNRYTRIGINDIVWIKPSGNYTELYIAGEKYRYRKSFSTIIEQLPQHLFIRIHKSHVVNVKHVKYISRKFVCIEEELYPIGDTYRKKLMNCLPILHT